MKAYGVLRRIRCCPGHDAESRSEELEERARRKLRTGQWSNGSLASLRSWCPLDVRVRLSPGPLLKLLYTRPCRPKAGVASLKTRTVTVRIRPGVSTKGGCRGHAGSVEDVGALRPGLLARGIQVHLRWR